MLKDSTRQTYHVGDHRFSLRFEPFVAESPEVEGRLVSCDHCFHYLNDRPELAARHRGWRTVTERCEGAGWFLRGGVEFVACSRTCMERITARLGRPMFETVR